MRRRRLRQHPLLEPMEDRVVLSSGNLASPGGVASISAEVFRAKKSPTQLVINGANGLQKGTATLTATLTSNGTPLAGKTVQFKLRGRPVGKATTDAQGIAILSNVKLKNMAAGVYPTGVSATFAGNRSQKPRTIRGSLTVSRNATSLGGVSAIGVYNGSVGFTATLTSNGAPVPGQAVSFSFNGRHIGDASTNNQGIATLTTTGLAGVNVGNYANAVTASFAGGVNFQQNAAGGSLTVSQAQAVLSLGNLAQTYDGSAESVTVATNPGGLAYSVSYKDANGNAVATPKAAGSYSVVATITDPNFTGSATGTLDIARAQVNVGGITASNKVYDGTTAATVDTGGATLSGVVAGDSVTLNASAASGVFDTKNVGTDQVGHRERPVADGGRCGELQPDRADDDREHHGRPIDRHRHHGRQQGIRRHHRRHPRHHQCHPGGRGLGRPGHAQYRQCLGDASTRRTSARARR